MFARSISRSLAETIGIPESDCLVMLGLRLYLHFLLLSSDASLDRSLGDIRVKRYSHEEQRVGGESRVV